MISFKKIVAIAIKPDKKAFVIYVAYLAIIISIYPVYKAEMALIIAKKITIPAKYFDFKDVFLKN